MHVPDFVRRGAATYRVISDHLGSPRYVVNINDQNDVPYRADYASFGSVSGAGLDWMPFGFAGGLYDGHTGLVRFGVRDYDPAVGRWTSKEPQRFNTLGTNLYLYALGDPLNLWDVTGRDVCVFSSAQGYHHRWIEIGGDPKRSYGFWPDNGMAFAEGRVESPDGRSPERLDPNTDSTCHEATPEEEDLLERWIRENYDINKPSERNPYILGLNDCRHFADDTIDELQRIQRNPWQIATDIFWGLW